MPTVKEIIREIQEEISEGSQSIERILAKINEGARSIAVGSFPQYGIPEINLKTLEASADVEVEASVTDLDQSGLTYEFCKGLIAASISGHPLKVFQSVAQLERYYPGLTATGTPEMAALSGRNLVVMPAGEAIVTIRYFAYPYPLTVVDIPSFLPDHLQMPLLKNYVLKSLTTKFLQGLEFDPAALFGEAVQQLFYIVGPYSPIPEIVQNPVWTYLDSSQC